MAGRFPRQWLEELRARADIVQIVSGYVPLKKNGGRWWGLCPFHGEKTASFSVNPDRQLYYCFGCKACGSVIDFVMNIEHLEFADAVKRLADQLHIPLPEMQEDPDWQKKRSQRERLLAANREAAQFYHRQLYAPEGEAALNYLKGRGLTDSVIRKFGLGAAASRRDALYRSLLEAGYTEEEQALAGLVKVYPADEEKGLPRAVRDMFHSRAMFPIIDQYGNVLGFGGRKLNSEDNGPKYLNTADTPVFNKRLGVFAANLLRKERALQRVILVEGYMDVVALTQFGVRGVCATLGTALTPEQALLLKRFAPTVYLAYDGDSAGQHAILRGLEVLEKAGVPARVLDFPDGLDPDEFMRQRGMEAFQGLPVLTPAAYRLRRAAAQQDLSTQEGRSALAREGAKIIAQLDPVEREERLRELTLQTGFSSETLLEQARSELPALQREEKRQQAAEQRSQLRAAPHSTAAPTERQRAEEMMISLLASSQLPKDIATEDDFSDPLLRSLYGALQGGATPSDLVESQATEQDKERVARLLFTQPGESVDEQLAMVEDCLNTLRRQRVEDRLSAVRERLKGLTGEEKAQALKEAAELTEELKRLRIR